MTFKRDIAPCFLESLKQYPIVTVIGPRQSGKTTLVKTLCEGYDYINLEQPDIREIAETDPRAIFNKYPSHLIIDEIQHVPKLLSYLQVIADEKQQDGMFVLTGSHQYELHQALTQSLAGRTALLQLLPLSLNELGQVGIKATLNEHLLTGGYPRIYQKQLNPTNVYRDYVKTYLERDVRQMIHLKDLLTFQRFIKLLAARTGTTLNMSALGNDIGISHHTIKHWLSILQASYLITFITPYFENFGKQIIKRPKMYFTDVGLACYLLEIESLAQVDRDPLRGQLFETLVAMELIKTRLNQAREPHLYFYRDNNQREVDLIYKQGSQLLPIEIKSGQTFNQSFLKGLEFFKVLVGEERVTQSYLIYAGEEEYKVKGTQLLNFQNVSRVI